MPPRLPPRNPYIAGKAVGQERGFCGREDVFRLVETVLSSPNQNGVVLFGQRRIGKTSIMLQLRRRLPSPPFRTVYFDLMDRARKPLGTVLYELAATIASEFGLPPPSEAEFGVAGDCFHQDFLPALYSHLGEGIRPVLLFDEFDVLDVAAVEQLPATAAARAFFPYLRRLMETQPRLGFVFVVGRKAEDLSIDVKATFKATRYQRVSVLDEDAARDLVSLAERDGTLHFTPAATERLLRLTARHPYLTQLMCQLLFDRAWSAEPQDAPTVDLADVDAVVPKALEAGENVFEWIWDGLPPAERVVFSAIAGATAEKPLIGEEELTGILQKHGIRILIRELELAPKTLIDWEMLRRVDGGYSPFIELMRCWVAASKPLPKVKDELDRVNPIADQQYQLGSTFYRLGNTQEALAPLKAAITANPNHLKARLLLGQVLREQGSLDEAVKVLEEAYRYDEDAARYPLVTALLIQGEAAERAAREDDALAIYDRVLGMSPRETAAQDRRQAILVARGDRAQAAGDFDGALAAYRLAGADNKIIGVLAAQRARALERSAGELDGLIQKEDWPRATETARRLIELDPDNKRWPAALERVEQEEAIARRYAEGLGSLHQGKWAEAQRALADVVHVHPDYKDAAEKLAEAIRGYRAEQEAPHERAAGTIRLESSAETAAAEAATAAAAPLDASETYDWTLPSLALGPALKEWNQLPTPLRCWLEWTGISTAVWLLAFAVLAHKGTNSLGGFVGGGLLGLLAGAGAHAVLRKRVEPAAWGIIATGVAWAAGWGLAAIIGGFYTTSVTNLLESASVAAVTVTLLLAVPRWLMLHGRLSRAAWLIPASILGIGCIVVAVALTLSAGSPAVTGGLFGALWGGIEGAILVRLPVIRAAPAGEAPGGEQPQAA